MFADDTNSRTIENMLESTSAVVVTEHNSIANDSPFEQTDMHKHDEQQVRKMCALCSRMIMTAQRGFYPLYDHVSAVHLRKPIYTCRLCGKSSTAYISGNIRSHVRRRHGGEHNPNACITSHRHLYTNELKRLMLACFDVQ